MPGHDDAIRRPGTARARWAQVFSGPVLACGGVVAALLGVLVAFQANLLVRDQNKLLTTQLRKTIEEQQVNLYFQQLNRRTHLLTVLYNTEEPVRVRREALTEFLRLDRELKETDVRNNPERYRSPDLYEDSQSPPDWARLVTLLPHLRTDLSGIVLRGMDMEFLDFSDTVLANADFSCSNLEFANLRRANLENAKFGGTDLGGAELHGAVATSADFSGARLNGAYLNDTWLQDANFSMAFLWKTNFADFRNARYPPNSAERAYVVDLYDTNKSGGAGQFVRWTRANGATTHTNYDAWQRVLARDAAAGLITLPCN